MKLYDVVALSTDLPALGLVAGQVGTAVLELADGVFEIEFADLQGVAYAQVPLRRDQVMVLHHQPVRLAA
jgi:hypothetical protein